MNKTDSDSTEFEYFKFSIVFYIVHPKFNTIITNISYLGSSKSIKHNYFTILKTKIIVTASKTTTR